MKQAKIRTASVSSQYNKNYTNRELNELKDLTRVAHILIHVGNEMQAVYMKE